MKWKIENNCISKLDVKGDNLILPWGMETADSSAFFSLEDGVGYRYQMISREVDHTDQHYRGCYVVQMVEGKWKLNIEDKILSEHSLHRTAKLLCLEDSHFMDFVMRFRFKKSYFPFAMIDGKKFQHANTNIYYQYPVREASLEGEKYQITLNVEEVQCPESLSPYMYVRDHEDEWVVHARMLPVNWDKEVVKLCNPWAKTRPLPQVLSNFLLAVPAIKKSLWYRGEKKPFTNRIMRRINPLACPIVKLKQGEELLWKVKVEIQ